MQNPIIVKNTASFFFFSLAFLKLQIGDNYYAWVEITGENTFSSSQIQYYY